MPLPAGTVECAKRLASVSTLLAILVTASPAMAQDQLADADAVSLLQARSGHTATLLDDDYILLAGGTDGGSELAGVEVVDPVGMDVEALGALVVARTDHSSTLLPDGRILIAGGRAGDAALDHAELLDPVSGESEPAGAMVVARAGHEAVLLDDGRVLFLGGLDGDTPVASAELFDPLSGTFAEAARPVAVHLDVTATRLRDGRVLLAGSVAEAAGGEAKEQDAKAGSSKSKKKSKKSSKKAQKESPPSKVQAAAELYDPAADRWLAVAGGDGIGGHQATLLDDGRVLLVGGAKAAAQLYDPDLGAFTPTTVPAPPRTEHTATALPDGRILLAGGADAGLELPELTAFDPATSSFTVLGEMLVPRTGHTATLTSDGRVIIAGGEFAGLALDDVLVFDPTAASLLPLSTDMEVAPDEAVSDLRTKAEVRAQFGAPDAFASYYHDQVEADGSFAPTSLQTWTYYGAGVEYTFAGERVIAEDPLELPPDQAIEAAPYDPELFHAYMPLEQVVSAAGLEEYIGAPADELIGGGELFLGQQLTWGMKDGELRYIEALALLDDGGSEEVD